MVRPVGSKNKGPIKRKPVVRKCTVSRLRNAALRKERLAIEEEELRLAEQEEIGRLRLKQYEDTHRTEFFKPFPHQGQALQFIVDGKKTVLMVGANQIGKTVFGANVADSFSQGCKSAGDGADVFPSIASRESGGRGVIGRILCNDWEKAARDTIVPKLKEWLPIGTYETKKNNVGVEYEFVFPKTGSKFTILTYKEDTKSHEGWTGDWVWADEPPPRDKYVANRRGLVARDGIFIMTMTAISEPWILDEIVLTPDRSVGIVADIPITANTTLSAEAIRVFEQSLTEDEKIARIKGGWMQLSGRIWKVFRTTPTLLESGTYLMPHVVQQKKIPPDWPVEFQIDFHLTIPHAISFCACDPLQRYFICEEVWENCGSEEIADHIIRLKQLHGWRMKYGEIDPLAKGDTGYLKNRFGKATEDSFTIIARKLRKYGMRLEAGSKDETSYIKAVETRLNGGNGMPTLFIMDNCRETIKQVSRWSYADNGKPKDDGHFPECIGRFTQSGLKYVDPVQYNAPLNLAACPV